MTPTTSRFRPLAAALAYVERDWPVVPLDGKIPRTANGCRDATTDRLTVERWWSRIWPAADIGIATGGGLVVLDVDGEDGADSLHALEAEHGALPETVSVVTGSGGAHHYFSHAGEIRNSAGKLGPGLDIRGDGGYVVAPPSRHENGRTYAWADDPDEVEIAPLPGWLAELLTADGRRAAATVGEQIPDGRRNAELCSLGGSMRRRGMSEGEIAAALLTVNAERCQPPLAEREVAAIAASVAKYAPAERPAGHAVEYDAKGALTLPPVPAMGETAALCGWLTVALALDPAHPITGGRRHGLLSEDGHAVLSRREARGLRFEPVRVISRPVALIETLAWQSLPSDGAVPPIKAEHCRQISHAVKMLCATDGAITAEQETEAIIGTLTQAGEPIEGASTYGDSQERYAAAMALRKADHERPRYLLDSRTGETVVAVGDLTRIARLHAGGSIPRGWLDGRMALIGWQRIRLDGHEQSGRVGRRGRHARIDAYRGQLPSEDSEQQPSSDDISVTT